MIISPYPYLYWKERDEWLQIAPTFNSRWLITSERQEPYGPFDSVDEAFDYADRTLKWTTTLKF